MEKDNKNNKIDEGLSWKDMIKLSGEIYHSVIHEKWTFGERIIWFLIALLLDCICILGPIALIFVLVFSYWDNFLAGCCTSGKIEIITVTVSFLVYLVIRLK